MQKDIDRPDAEDEKLVDLHVLVPRRVKKWISGLAFQRSSPDQTVSRGDIAREMLEEKYRELVKPGS